MSYEEIGTQLDLPRLGSLYAYQSKHPPLHLMVAAYLGIDSTVSSQDKAPDTDVLQFMQMYPNG